MPDNTIPPLTTKNFVDVCNAISDGIYISDRNGNTIWMNDASENLCGVPKSEMIGRNVADLEAAGIFTPSISRMALEQGKTTTAVQTSTNGRKYLVTGYLITGADGQVELVVAHSRDITEALRTSSQLEEMEGLIRRLSEEFSLIRRQQEQSITKTRFLGASREYQAMLELIKQVAVVDSTVLITGETGVGKSLIAEYIHQLSDRCKQPFVHINCAAIPESLIESELFGYKKGAFTGASSEGKIGLVKMAEKGTLFLDEISELPFHLQSKLLLLLQNKTYMPIGDTKTYTADVRIIAATNSNLYELTKSGKFRRDLYYRLSVLPIQVPPLRERRDDIFPLLYFYLQKFNEKHHQKRRFSTEVLDVLQQYDWPGNVRELENLVERLVITSKDEEILIQDLPEELRSTALSDESLLSLSRNLPLPEKLGKIEAELIRQALQTHKTTRKAAAALGITQSLLMRRLKKYGIQIQELQSP